MAQETIIVGKTLQITLPLSAGTLGTVTVTFPSSGAQVGTDPGNQTINGVLCQVRLFTAAAALATGAYNLPVTIELSGQTITTTLGLTVAESGASYHTDVYDLIRDDLLRVDSNALPDATIDRAFARLSQQVIARFPCIGAYAGVTGADGSFLDDALGHMAAVQLHSFKYKAGAGGLLTGQTIGDFKYAYGTDSRDERDGWTDQAAISLGFVSCIRLARVARASGYTLALVAGRSRGRQMACAGGGLLAPVLEIYAGFYAWDPKSPWGDGGGGEFDGGEFGMGGLL